MSVIRRPRAMDHHAPTAFGCRVATHAAVSVHVAFSGWLISFPSRELLPAILAIEGHHFDQTLPRLVLLRCRRDVRRVVGFGFRDACQLSVRALMQLKLPACCV